MKCRYLDELTGGRGVVFATDPISNSMTELYTMQRYLHEVLRSQACSTSTHGLDTGDGHIHRACTRRHGIQGENAVCEVLQLLELISMFKRWPISRPVTC